MASTLNRLNLIKDFKSANYFQIPDIKMTLCSLYFQINRKKVYTDFQYYFESFFDRYL